MEYNNDYYDYENKKKIIVEDKSKKNGSKLSTISLVFGIISLVVCWAFVFPIVIGITGLIIGIMSLVQEKEGNEGP